MTKEISIKNIKIGGGNDIAIQSMTNTKTADIDATLNQFTELFNAGCDIVRVAVYDNNSAEAIKVLSKNSPMPVVADVHFDYKLAIKAIENGANKIRINPGNIGGDECIEKVCSAAKLYGVPIRVGANSGSIEKQHLQKYGNSAKALAESALQNVRILEKQGFYNIVISVKASDVKKTIQANRLLSKSVDYPLHIGVTEAGSRTLGLYKSAVGIGSLLVDGIGDTIRISLTSDPVEEVIAAKHLLQAIGIKKDFVEIISCPTCSRCNVNLNRIVKEVEEFTLTIKKPLKVAIMGCIVNGPGEAMGADIGLAGGDGKCAIFKKGKILKTIDESIATATLISEIKNILDIE